MTTPNLVEKPDSRPLSIGSSNTHDRECFIFNATSQDSAVATMLANTTVFPLTYTTVQAGTTYTFIRGSAAATPVRNATNQGSTIWDGKMTYQLQGFVTVPYQTGDNVTTFEIGFKSENVKYNPNEPGATGIYATTDSPYSGDNSQVPDFKGLIGVTNDSVAGVDLDYPTFSWSETHYMADSDVTTSQVNAWYAVANAPINDDTFRDIAGGEVKFLGVTGTRRFNGGDWELNFKFAASPSTTSLYIGNIGPITKTGWEYVWVHYVPKNFTFGSFKSVIQYPLSAYVEIVYNVSDFSTLGIGT